MWEFAILSKKDLAELWLRLSRIEYLLRSLTWKEDKTMATIDDLVTEVANEATQIASVKTFIQGLQQQLADALSGVTLPADVQAKVDAVFASMQANDAALAGAINANTAAAGTTAPAANAPAADATPGTAA